MRSLAREESGWTLIELMVVTLVSVVVFIAIATVLDGAGKLTNSTGGRVQALDTASVALERMTRSIRQATSVGTITSPSSTLTISIWEGPTGGVSHKHTVTFTCVVDTDPKNGFNCTRSDFDQTTNQSSTPTKLIDGLTSPNVFSMVTSSTTYPAVQVTLTQSVSGSVTAQSASPFVLQESVVPRNCPSVGATC